LTEYTLCAKSENELRTHYYHSFPVEERRDWDQLNELLKHPGFKLYKIFNDNSFAGLISVWKWSDLTFIEHFAIVETLQGKGIGKDVIKLVIKDIPNLIVLEVEENKSLSACRRINFYEQLGFKLCREKYYQPPYQNDKKPVKMLLMSYPEMVTNAMFNTIKIKLYKEVYQCNNIDLS